jgi:hypothetical protein
MRGHFDGLRTDFRLSLRSRANLSSVRFFAAASDAFLARADLSSGVELRAAFLPPCRPYSRAISVIAALTFAGILIAMHSIVHLTGYGEEFRKILIQTVLTP